MSFPWRPSRLPAVRAAVAVGLALLLTACGGSDAAPGPPTQPRPQGDSVRVVAVGDVACPASYDVSPTECQQGATAELAASVSPDAVAALGDLQYTSGELEQFRAAYDTSWGRFRDITYPVPGNHEYETGGADGYATYFGDRLDALGGTSPEQPAWAADLGAWRVYGVDTNCSFVDCAAQGEWLRDRLAESDACSVVLTHHPRVSSGRHGANDEVQPIWEAAVDGGADLVLAAHDHLYERFEPLAADGTPDADGVPQYVSGAGGRSLYPVEERRAGSVAGAEDAFGVLVLDLAEDGWSRRFLTTDGRSVDEGSDTCR